MSHPTTRTRTKVYCFCKKCDGSLVDPRTKKNHMLKYTSDTKDNNQQEAGPSITEPPAELSDAASNDSFSEMDIDPLPVPEIIEPPLSGSNYFFLTKKLPIRESAGSILLSDDKSDRNDDLNIEDRGFEDTEDSEDDGYRYSEDDQNSVSDEDDEEDEEDGDEEVNFMSTEYDDNETDLPNIDLNYNFTWIILWILQYQQRYKLPNVAIDSLFKFLNILLLAIDETKFSTFPSSLYKAKKTLGMSLKLIKYAACNKCHKLYNIKEILNETEIPTCSFVNFPNHSMERFRQKCNNPLTKKIDSNNHQIFRPIMTFPLVRIKQQLTLFFGRKNFEMSCRKWAERKNETDALFDIYDGMIWKSFRDDNGEPFFTEEHAETHIGLMLNMDWWQSDWILLIIYGILILKT